MIRNILVTGSSGTIGTRLCEKLLERNYAVRGVDWVPNKWSERVNSLTTNADLRSREQMEALPTDADLVIHLAANARVYNLVLDPVLARDNFETLFNTLEFCRKNAIKRILFASSREVYGNSDQIVHSENEAYVRNCESPYTASKVGGEALVHAYHQCYNLDFVIVRFSNVYGMYDDTDRVIPLFIKKTTEETDFVVYGEEKKLDFTYIDDAVHGVLKCIEKFDGVRNDVFNIASGQGLSLLEVARRIQSAMAGKNKLSVEPSRTGEVEKFIANISKAKRILGYSPEIMIEEGIGKSVQWYRENLYKNL
jgi:UDP-glucose 4-epimerase